MQQPLAVLRPIATKPTTRGQAQHLLCCGRVGPPLGHPQGPSTIPPWPGPSVTSARRHPPGGGLATVALSTDDPAAALAEALTRGATEDGTRITGFGDATPARSRAADEPCHHRDDRVVHPQPGVVLPAPRWPRAPARGRAVLPDQRDRLRPPTLCPARPAPPSLLTTSGPLPAPPLCQRLVRHSRVAVATHRRPACPHAPPSPGPSGRARPWAAVLVEHSTVSGQARSRPAPHQARPTPAHHRAVAVPACHTATAVRQQARRHRRARPPPCRPPAQHPVAYRTRPLSRRRQRRAHPPLCPRRGRPQPFGCRTAPFPGPSTAVSVAKPATLPAPGSPTATPLSRSHHRYAITSPAHHRAFAKPTHHCVVGEPTHRCVVAEPAHHPDVHPPALPRLR
ncbi:hypothetical protein JOD54_004707 [Actinokineospora baliensis]|nr:hypothetical protein [Actinokineospora baliensis]